MSDYYESSRQPEPPSRLDVDIAWYDQQAQACADALVVYAQEPAGSDRAAQIQTLMGSLGRYQATLEHLLRLKAMTERAMAGPTRRG